MTLRLASFLCACAVALQSAGCAHTLQAPGELDPSGLSLRLIGAKMVKRGEPGVPADFGGISGLDRDAATGTWFLLSDDRSERAPVRFYTAKIGLDETGFGHLEITDTVTLRRPDGAAFPSLRHGGRPPDAEALRLDPLGDGIYWAGEADRLLGIDAFVRHASRDGRHRAELPLPPRTSVDMQAERGPRHNLSFEGLAFTPDGSRLWVAMEGPLFEDGPPPSISAGALARFTQLDRQGRVLAQFAYPLDPVQRAPTGGRLRADNGVSEILALDMNTLLVLERSGREVGENVFRFSVRIYEATIVDATDVSEVVSLRGAPSASFMPMRKRLILDLDRIGLDTVDNLEAASWGPHLRNGNRTLVLASDDNFLPGQVNQFIAFEVIPTRKTGSTP